MTYITITTAGVCLVVVSTVVPRAQKFWAEGFVSNVLVLDRFRNVWTYNPLNMSYSSHHTYHFPTLQSSAPKG